METHFSNDAVKQINASNNPVKKFISEVSPLADEIEAINKMDAAIASGDLYDESDIDWN